LDDRGSIAGSSKRVVLAPYRPVELRGTSLPVQRAPMALSAGVKRPGREADFSPSSGHIRRGGAMSLLPHTTSWLDVK
jgi:hypothetical protein